MSNLDWLYSAEEPDYEATDVQLSEGGTYTNDQVGLWKFGTVWKLQTELDVNLKELGHAFDGSSVKPYGNLYYWTNANYEVAKAVGKAINSRFGPQHVWHFDMKSADFLNFKGKDKTAAEVFGDVIDFDIKLSSVAADSRATFQLMMLPSIIQELALLTGKLKTKIYDYSKLPNNQDDLMGDAAAKLERQMHYIGNNDTWLDSELGKARTQIWAAPQRYLVENACTVDEWNVCPGRNTVLGKSG